MEVMLSFPRMWPSLNAALRNKSMGLKIFGLRVYWTVGLALNSHCAPRYERSSLKCFCVFTSVAFPANVHACMQELQRVQQSLTDWLRGSRRLLERTIKSPFGNFSGEEKDHFSSLSHEIPLKETKTSYIYMDDISSIQLKSIWFQLNCSHRH